MESMELSLNGQSHRAGLPLGKSLEAEKSSQKSVLSKTVPQEEETAPKTKQKAKKNAKVLPRYNLGYYRDQNNKRKRIQNKLFKDELEDRSRIYEQNKNAPKMGISKPPNDDSGPEVHSAEHTTILESNEQEHPSTQTHKRKYSADHEIEQSSLAYGLSKIDYSIGTSKSFQQVHNAEDVQSRVVVGIEEYVGSQNPLPEKTYNDGMEDGQERNDKVEEPETKLNYKQRKKLKFKKYNAERAKEYAALRGEEA